MEAVLLPKPSIGVDSFLALQSTALISTPERERYTTREALFVRLRFASRKRRVRDANSTP